MIRKWIEDLRFLIGLFFGLISLILVLAGFVVEPVMISEWNLNLIAGGYIGCFSLVMLGLGVGLNKKAKY